MPEARAGAAAEAPTRPAAPSRTGAQPAGRVRQALAGWRDPQHRDGLALVLSSAITSAVGLLYWVVAARLFTPDEVGVNSTLISTMTLLGITAQLNLGSALLRFVPVAGSSARTLVSVCYAVAAAVGCAVGAAFAGGAVWWARDLVDALGSGPLLAFFAVATPVWAIFAMQVHVLTASRHATLVPLSNLAFSLLKIGLLGVGTLVVFRGVIAVSWALATAVIVLVVTVYVMRVLRPAAGTAGVREEIRPRNIARFMSANWVGGLCTDVVEFGLPLIVLAILDPDSAATFGMVWAIAYALYLVTHGMSQSMVAHVSANPDGLRAATRAMVVKALTLIVPGVLVIVPGAGLILSIFGPHYAETGTTLLALCALSAVPNVVVVAAISVARVQQRGTLIIAVPAAVAAIVISLALTLPPGFGLAGIGIALLVGQSVVAVVILVVMLGTRLRPRART